jgi:hypothetical protein
MPDKEPLRLSDDDALVVGYVEDFYALLRAIDEVMPRDAVLYLEGTSIVGEVAAFLDTRQLVDQPAIEANTLWPKPRFFHLPLTGTNLAELRALAEHHAEPEVADHLVVYRDIDVLLWAHDAGAGYVTVSRFLPEETVERFRSSLGGALRFPDG